MYFVNHKITNSFIVPGHILIVDSSAAMPVFYEYSSSVVLIS